jgi:hypothetical protein
MENYYEIKKLFDLVDNSNLKTMKVFDETFKKIYGLIENSNISNSKMKKIKDWSDSKLPIFRFHYEKNLNIPGITDNIKNEFLTILLDEKSDD